MDWNVIRTLLALALALWTTRLNWRYYRSGQFPVTRAWSIRRNEGPMRFRLAALLLVGLPAVGVLTMAFVLFAIWLTPGA